MPLIPIQRLVSHTTTVVGAPDREIAVHHLLSGMTPNVVKMGTLYDENEAIAKLFHGDTTFLPGPDPHRVKYTELPETTYSPGYAAQTHPINLDLSNQFLIALLVFSKTEMHTQVEIADFDALNLLSATPPLIDGGETTIPVFSSLRKNSSSRAHGLQSYTVPLSFDAEWTGLDVKFVFSFEPIDNFAPLSEGFAFVAELYQSIPL